MSVASLLTEPVRSTEGGEEASASALATLVSSGTSPWTEQGLPGWLPEPWDVCRGLRVPARLVWAGAASPAGMAVGLPACPVDKGKSAP